MALFYRKNSVLIMLLGLAHIHMKAISIQIRKSHLNRIETSRVKFGKVNQIFQVPTLSAGTAVQENVWNLWKTNQIVLAKKLKTKTHLQPGPPVYGHGSAKLI